MGSLSGAALAAVDRLVTDDGWPMASAAPSPDEPVAADGSLRYYGTVDATPLFLILAARVAAAAGDGAEPGGGAEPGDGAGPPNSAETGGGPGGAAVAEALGWLERALDAGGGLLAYRGHRHGGLYHQGWRDGPYGRPGVGIRWPDGAEVDDPVAVASAQGFAYQALRSHGRHAAAERLADAVDEAFYRHGEAWPALAVDGAGRAVPTLASEIGVLLWSGVLRPHRVEGAVAALQRLSSGWGLWTVAPEHPVFDPTAYHHGAVWPFESWFGWGGLRRAGATAQAEAVRQGVLGAVGRIGRAPECYAAPPGGAPVVLERANRTQAWTAGAVWALANGWDAADGADGVGGAGVSSTARR